MLWRWRCTWWRGEGGTKEESVRWCGSGRRRTYSRVEDAAVVTVVVVKGEGLHLQCSGAAQSTCSYHSRRPAHKKVNPRPLAHSTVPTPRELIEFLARCNITSAEERTHHTYISALYVWPANARDTVALCVCVCVCTYIYSRTGGRPGLPDPSSSITIINCLRFTGCARERPSRHCHLLCRVFLYTRCELGTTTRPGPDHPSFRPVQSGPVQCAVYRPSRPPTNCK